LEFRVRLHDGEQLAERAGQLLFGRRHPAHALEIAAGGGLEGLVPGLDHGLERLFLELHRAFDGFDQVRNQVVATPELDVNLLERVLRLVLEGDEPVVRADQPDEATRNDDANDDDAGHVRSCKRWIQLGGATRPTQSLRGGSGGVSAWRQSFRVAAAFRRHGAPPGSSAKPTLASTSPVTRRLFRGRNTAGPANAGPAHDPDATWPYPAFGADGIAAFLA